uniref:hypothetical protein n=1 Tax=Anaerococcus mediterraneensis TaxID=1870984 RepID=UPI0009310436|nr:hypothetical protein [Anaerococcus mediterraneensis]
MDNDGCGCIFVAILIIALIYVFSEIFAFLFLGFFGLAFGGGLVWGGFTSLKNYYQSFKENIIDANRKGDPDGN